MQFRRGKDLEQMPDQLGGLAYSKNYVARSRMEQVLQQDEQQTQAARQQPAPVPMPLPSTTVGRMAGVDSAPLRKRRQPHAPSVAPEAPREITVQQQPIEEKKGQDQDQGQNTQAANKAQRSERREGGDSRQYHGRRDNYQQRGQRDHRDHNRRRDDHRNDRDQNQSNYRRHEVGQDDHRRPREEKRWRKRDFKRENRDENRSERAAPSTSQLKRFEPITDENFVKICDDAVASFLAGDLSEFKDLNHRLDNVKIGNVRTLLNREQVKLKDTEGDQFNRKFNMVNQGDEEASEAEEDAPQIMTEDGAQSLANAGASAKDYLAGMSRSLEKDLHKEVLMEQRNLLMRIRMEDTSMRKYQISNTGFEMDLVERKIKDKQSAKWDRNSKNREIVDFSRGQKAHQNCRMCFYNKKRQSQDSYLDAQVGESDHWLILFPQSIKPLSPMGSQEPLTHVQLIPKEHSGSTMELDEDAARDLQSLKKTLARYWRKSEPGKPMRTVFVETSFEQDVLRGSHMIIDAVGVPDSTSEADEEDEDAGFDLELVFQKVLLEGDSEWNQSTAKKVIDTKGMRGDLSRCLPTKGRFSFVHIDFDGMGGIAHVIEDTLKFGKFRILDALAGGPLGNVMFNLKQPLRREECRRISQKMKSSFSEFLEKER